MTEASLIVQKYGGSSLARPEQIQVAAEQIAKLHKLGHAVIVVVSAMGKTTDQLVELAYRVSPTPNRRELDMLLTTGERISMSLMSMALNDRHCPAISFTGSQAGVFTDELHSNARIIDVKPVRIEAELTRNHVVVLAGFQGVSPRTKEITTLGRGGSDTTAVAMAAVFKAQRCEIRKDVDGVHSADPHLIQGTVHLPHLHYQTLLEMTYWGSKVLHYRSVELAALMDIPLMIALAHGEGRNTLINGEFKMFEQARILSVNTHKDVRSIQIEASQFADAFRLFAELLKKADLPLPQFLDSYAENRQVFFLITAPTETLDAIELALKSTDKAQNSARRLASVTATCQGSFASPLPGEIAAALERHSIPLYKILFSAMSVTVIVDAKDCNRVVQTIHDLRSNSSPSA